MTGDGSAMRKGWMLAAVAVFGMPAAAQAVVVPVAGDLVLTYVTVYDPPGTAAPERRTHLGLAGVPTPLDVGDSVAPDLLATVTLSANGAASLEVSRTPLAPAQLPVAVEAVLANPESAGRRVIGYDARASDAPAGIVASFEIDDDGISVASNASSPGSSFAMVAQLFAPGADAPRTDLFRVAYAPVPAVATATMRVAGSTGSLQVAVSAATRLEVLGERHDGDRTSVLDATISELAGTASLAFESGPFGMSAHHDASAPIAEIDATLTQTEGSATLATGVLELRDVPTQVDLAQPSADGIKVTANAPIGTASAGFALGGPVRRLDPVANPAYVLVSRDDAVTSKAVHLPGARHLDLSLANGVALESELRAAPFRAVLDDGARTLDATIHNLPEAASLSYAPTTGTLSYVGSDPVGSMQIAASDPVGLLGRATNVDLRLLGVPAAFSLTAAQIGDRIDIDANGAQIGVLELTATNGPTPTLPSSQDGVQLLDRGNPYLFAARLTGMRAARIDIAPDPSMVLDTVGERAFSADLDVNGQFLRASLDVLRPMTRLALVPHAGAGSRILYSASGSAGSLFLATNGDEASDHLQATFAPVPSAFELCSSSDAGCNTTPQASNGGAIRFAASQATTINLFECIRPLTGCAPQNATVATSVTDLRARAFGLDVNVNGAPLSSVGNRVFLDTDNTELAGTIEKRLENPTMRSVLRLPSGFRAQDRLVLWGPGTGQNPSGITRTGTITCPAGTQFDVALPTLTVDVDAIIC